MDNALIKALLWNARWYAARAGRPFWLGCGLLFGALFVYLALALPALHEAETHEDEARHILAQADRNHSQQPVQKEDDRVAEFYRSLPANDALSTWLQTLSQSADANGIPFHQGDYRYALEKDRQFGRYIVDLSLSGGYPNLRNFLAETLSTMPFVGIEELTVAREGIDGEDIEVQLRLALYFAHAKGGRS